jgi:hypothetical protein
VPGLRKIVKLALAGSQHFISLFQLISTLAANEFFYLGPNSIIFLFFIFLFLFDNFLYSDSKSFSSLFERQVVVIREFGLQDVGLRLESLKLLFGKSLIEL